MDLRMEFMTRLNNGERMTELCHEYGIARKTGHKLKNRFEEFGVTGLCDQSRAPKHIPHKTPPEVVELIVDERKRHPDWGPRKLKHVLEERLGHAVPSASTLGVILERHGLIVYKKTRARHPPRPTGLQQAEAPNDVWCVDYKGQFRLGDRSYCYPLTVTDQHSRYILCCDGMAAIDEDQARESFEVIFRSYGLPSVMRSDNGVPFASNGLCAFSKLSVYWLRLGIRPERIRPAHPEENGRHERMHRTLKCETTRPPRLNLLQQQEVFDKFVSEFNADRPHEALDMKRPAQVYTPSSRPYPAELPPLEYPTHDDVLRVSSKGQLHLPGRGRLYLAAALTGYDVGLRELDDGRWLITFMHIDLGHIERNKTFTPLSLRDGHN